MGRAAQDRKEGIFEGHLGMSRLKGQGSRKANFREEIEAESRNCLRSPNQEVGGPGFRSSPHPTLGLSRRGRPPRGHLPAKDLNQGGVANGVPQAEVHVLEVQPSGRNPSGD